MDPTTGKCLPCPTTQEVRCYKSCGCDDGSYTCTSSVAKCCSPNGCGGSYYMDPSSGQCVVCPTTLDVKCHKTCQGDLGVVCPSVVPEKCCLPSSQGGCGGTNYIDPVSQQCIPCPIEPVFCAPARKPGGPAPLPKPAPAPKPVPLPKPVPKPVPLPKPAPAPKPVPLPKPVPAAPKPVPRPKPAPAPKPVPLPKPVPAAPKPLPRPKPAPAPKPVPLPKPAPAPKPVPVVTCFGTCTESTITTCGTATVEKCCDPNGCGGTNYADPVTGECLPCPRVTATEQVRCYKSCGCDPNSYICTSTAAKCCSPDGCGGSYYMDPSSGQCVVCPTTLDVKCHKTCQGDKDILCQAVDSSRCCLPASLGGCGGTNYVEIGSQPQKCIPCLPTCF